MDGNGRWAKARGLPRSLGHKEGCERIIEIYEECMAQKIEVMSLYAFSTENWKRPKTEIRQLFIYLNQFFKRELKRIIADGSRVIISGDITKLPEKTQKVVIDAMDKTKDGKNFTLNICLNYGGKAELVRAAKEIAKEVLNGEIRVDDIDESLVDNSLYTKGLPPVDLLIRTSGEMRTSNFMPWQLAYAEMMFPITPWPSFTKTEFHKCLDEFKNRSRRFGGLKNE
jgi:undecaprenyl diphosphate synthase